MSYYPNWKHQPALITKQELKAIQRRRRIEKKLVVQAEKLGQPMRLNGKTIWFIVSNKWLFKWKCFINNTAALNNFFDNEEWIESVN